MTAAIRKVPIEITLVAPWSLPGSQTGALGVDVTLARKAGKPIIASTHLKGVLRDCCEALMMSCPELELEKYKIKDLTRLLFGEPDGVSGQAPDGLGRGKLQFYDLVAENAPEESSDLRAVRVEIDPYFGSAKEGHLLFIECPWPYGTEVSFSGVASLVAADEALAKATRLLLERATGLLLSIGGMKSSGFGRVSKTSVGDFAIESTAILPDLAAGRIQVTYNIDRDFLVNAKRIGSNLSQGDSTIPGAAIKGALAQALEIGSKDKSWQDALSAMVIGHAFATPSDASMAAHPLPLSLYTRQDTASGATKIHCALSEAFQMSGQVSFQMDWKNGVEHRVRKSLGLPFSNPNMTGRTRTAIDADSSTAKFSDDEGGALFSQVSIDPQDHIWIGELVLPDHQELRAALLELLTAGCPGLGKTKAAFKAVDIKPISPSEASQECVNLTLISEAILLDPTDLRPDKFRNAYKNYFSNLGLTLHEFYARQSLKGDYLALRYSAVSGQYSPWVTTIAGSVFRISAETDKGREALTNIVQNGLPPAHKGPMNWECFPFSVENGFGHVALNTDLHSKLKQGVDLLC